MHGRSAPRRRRASSDASVLSSRQRRAAPRPPSASARRASRSTTASIAIAEDHERRDDVVEEGRARPGRAVRRRAAGRWLAIAGEREQRRHAEAEQQQSPPVHGRSLHSAADGAGLELPLDGVEHLVRRAGALLDLAPAPLPRGTRRSPMRPCAIARRSISCWNHGSSCRDTAVPSSANAFTSDGTSCQ